MAFEGFLRLGGVEIVNNERARGIASTATCPMHWLKGPRCDTLRDALGDSAYTAANTPDAPWYDLSMPDLTSRFFGVFALSVSGLNDSTRSAPVIESIDDGAVIGRTRKGSRQVRIRAILLAQGRDALDYGIAWLNAALDPDSCGQHGMGCGTTDLEFFTDCPPPRILAESDESYFARVEPYRRFLHNVSATSGPYERDLYNVGGFWGQVMEWTLTAGRPWVYSATRPVDLPVTPTVVIQDTPYNLVPYPSAELSGGAALDVAVNYSTNPSLETNATGWTAVADGAGITSGMLTSGRVTGELAAVGVASFRTVFTATGASPGGGGWFGCQQEVAIPSAGLRYSLNLWSAEVIASGVPVQGDLEFVAYWRAGGVTLRTDVLGTVPVNGGALSVKSIAPPATATSVIIRAIARVTSWANGNVIRLYTDALAVTVP